MKKHYYLFLLFFIPVSAFAQILIQESNFIRPTAYTVNWDTHNDPSLQLPAEGNGISWIYSTIPSNGSSEEEYIHVNNPMFNANSDNCIQQSTVDYEGLALDGIYFYDVNENGYFQNGIHANEFKEYIGDALPPGWGGPNDSIIFEETDIVFAEPYQLVEFPSGYMDSWGDTITWEAGFVLNIENLSFNHLPGAYQQTTGVSCEIVGEGTIELPYESGIEEFPALLIKTEEFRIDSFFINGEAADQSLLDLIDVTQGGVTTYYTYDFFVPGMHSYALRLYTNSSYSDVIYSRFNTDLPEPVGMESISKNIRIFPNPASNYITIEGGKNFDSVYITDMQGKKVLERNGMCSRLNVSALSKGVYVLTMCSKEQVVVKRFIKS